MLLHLLRSGIGTNETKEPRRINSAYRSKADSIQRSPFSRLMTQLGHKRCRMVHCVILSKPLSPLAWV
jgi:hypothetical protein